MSAFRTEHSWRRQQSAYLFARKMKSLFQKWRIPFLLFFLLSSAVTGGWVVFNTFRSGTDAPHPPAVSTVSLPSPVHLTRAQVREMIKDEDLVNAARNVFLMDTPMGFVQVGTFLDVGLTGFLNARLDQLKTLTRGKPRQIAVVVMDGHQGHILAMAGFDLESSDTNPCTQAIYPAASIFKIVTAAAAMDALNYTPKTPLYFNGNKYTLYKRQLREVKNKYTIKVSLEKAFAESINPVFGKLGQTYLGRDTLSSYAHAFGFNQTPDTDLMFDTGVFHTTDTDFHLAELGCGFNRDTVISPVFGAMMLTPLLNEGRSVLPAVIRQVTDADGNLIYQHTPALSFTAMSPETALAMAGLMEKTVTQGTARKSFGSFSRDKVLSRLSIGGKTGSLSNREHTIKYDWFTGFARQKTGTRAITFSVVVGHGEYIGTRAASHARSLIKHYFESHPPTD
ncbi:MAG: penicillin-binding transpeptidase domain-containing protein [Desulfotignum sp.]|nr:penicillin-binding transpeptidase domain-containing protein [Desulfotignum sp.]